MEQSAVVWHSSLSAKNTRDLERVQKVAVRVILGKNHTTYKEGLKNLNLEDLSKRRKGLCLKFAKNCLKNEKVRSIFPKNITNHKMKKRNTRKYQVNKANTKRYQQSAVPYMVNLLNAEEKRKKKLL